MRPLRRWRSGASRRRSCRPPRSTRPRPRSRNIRTSSPRAAGARCRPAPTLKIGSKGPRVLALRDRLVASGDLDPVAGAGPVYDSFVEAAVKRFQARHGLGQTGVVSEEVFAELNVPAAARLQQLETNIVRLRAFSGDLGSRFVIVNIPAASVETVEGGGRLFPPCRRRRQDRPPVADHADARDRDQFQSVLDGAAFADQEGPDPEDEGGPELPDRREDPRLRQGRAGGLARRRSTGTPTRRRITNIARTRAPT